METIKESVKPIPSSNRAEIPKVIYRNQDVLEKGWAPSTLSYHNEASTPLNFHNLYTAKDLKRFRISFSKIFQWLKNQFLLILSPGPVNLGENNGFLDFVKAHLVIQIISSEKPQMVINITDLLIRLPHRFKFDEGLQGSMHKYRKWPHNVFWEPKMHLVPLGVLKQGRRYCGPEW